MQMKENVFRTESGQMLIKSIEKTQSELIIELIKMQISLFSIQLVPPRSNLIVISDIPNN